MNRKNLAKRTLSLVAAALGIYYVVSQLPLSRTRSILTSSDPVFLGASFLTLGAIYFMMGERWRQILLENGIEIEVFKSFKQLVASDFVNTFAPARAGDIYRGFLASDDEKDSLETSIMVLMERVLDVSVISILLIFALVGFLPSQDLLLYPALMLIIVLLGIGALQIIWRIENLPTRSLNRFYIRFRKATTENFGSDRWMALFILTFFIWLVGVVRTFLVFEAMNLSIGLGAVAIVTFSWAIIAALPLSPSGIGTTDAAVFFILGQFGVSADMAGAFIILNRAVLQGFPLSVGGLMYLKINGDAG